MRKRLFDANGGGETGYPIYENLLNYDSSCYLSSAEEGIHTSTPNKITLKYYDDSSNPNTKIEYSSILRSDSDAYDQYTDIFNYSSHSQFLFTAETLNQMSMFFDSFWDYILGPGTENRDIYITIIFEYDDSKYNTGASFYTTNGIDIGADPTLYKLPRTDSGSMYNPRVSIFGPLGSTYVVYDSTIEYLVITQPSSGPAQWYFEFQ